MTPTDYMFLPYLDYSTNMQWCILAINGPVDSPLTPALEKNANFVLLGQRFFASFPMAISIDRDEDSYKLTIGSGAAPSSLAVSLTITIGATVVVIVLLFILAIKLLLIRQRRLMADQWLQENANRLIDYVVQGKADNSGLVDALRKSRQIADGGQLSSARDLYAKARALSANGGNIFKDSDDE
jgi:hypothetical protein